MFVIQNIVNISFYSYGKNRELRSRCVPHDPIFCTCELARYCFLHVLNHKTKEGAPLHSEKIIADKFTPKIECA